MEDYDGICKLVNYMLDEIIFIFFLNVGLVNGRGWYIYLIDFKNIIIV